MAIIDINNVQSILGYIQIFKYLRIFGLSGTKPKDNIYRCNYIDCVTLCDTYDIFQVISDKMKEQMNDTQVTVEGVFSDIDYGDSIKSLLKFS